MNVTVAEVLAGAEVRAVPLGAECVGYLVLAAADQIGAAPRRVAPQDLLLFEDGTVRVAAGRAAEDPTAEADLRSVLDALLFCSSAPTSGLLRASRRQAGAGVGALVRELETALIPVNRAAAKRALARLERETVRALESGRISMAPPAPEAPSVSPPLAEPEPSAKPPVVKAEPPVVKAEPPVVKAEPPVVEMPEPSVEPPVARAEHTVMMAHVAPKVPVVAPAPPRADEPPLAETRPEPVVLRASARPPAPPLAAMLEPIAAEPVRTEPLHLPLPKPSLEPMPVVSLVEAVAEPIVVPPPHLAPPSATPVLGTLVTALSDLTPLPPPPPAASVDDEVELFEVIFEPEEHTILPDDDELIYSHSDLTSPCPPLESSSDSAPPPVELAAESEPRPSEVPTFCPFFLEPMEPVSARRSLLPARMTVVADPEPEFALEPVTPPPRVALPEPRPSDVDELLGRLDEVPFTLDELSSGLKLLAGMEPTPAPPRIASGER